VKRLNIFEKCEEKGAKAQRHRGTKDRRTEDGGQRTEDEVLSF